MPSQTPTTLSLLAAALLALTGCGETEDVSPNFEDRIPPGLAFEAADRVLEWGEVTSFSGQLTQGEEKLADETVTLEADTYPFDESFRALGTAQTDDQGAFEFDATPDSNTSYRIAHGELSETHSKERRVYVEPRTTLKTRAVGSRTLFTTVFRHPKDRSIQGSSLFSYAAPVANAEATGELQFVRVDKVEQLSLGLSEASIQLPLAEDDVRYSVCVGYRADAGLGAPNDTCSQSSVPAD